MSSQVADILATPRARTGVRLRPARLGTLLATGFRRSIAIVLFLALWEVAPRAGLVDKTFLVPFSEALSALWKLGKDGTLWDNVSISMVRASAGFAIALAIAIPLGFVIGWYSRAQEVLSPLLEVFRNTATLALLPVFTLLLGIGETTKIVIVVYACTFPIVLNTISGVQTVDPLLVKSARSMGLGSLELFRKVVLPAAVPTIFTGIRMAGSYAILVLVAAEMVGAKAGLGFFINYSQNNFAIPNMYAGILTIAVIGILVNTLLVRLERHFSSWRVEIAP
ncbi:MAG TPA: ABC transporter permease [Baekduia sp.]|nr:ABC transporter permease [Baekduia sp.]